MTLAVLTRHIWYSRRFRASSLGFFFLEKRGIFSPGSGSVQGHGRSVQRKAEGSWGLCLLESLGCRTGT